jgi:hypothetical protein
LIALPPLIASYVPEVVFLAMFLRIIVDNIEDFPSCYDGNDEPDEGADEEWSHMIC